MDYCSCSIEDARDYPSNGYCIVCDKPTYSSLHPELKKEGANHWPYKDLHARKQRLGI